MKYKELGYSSLEEYKKEFYETLMPSNNTKDYFVNWEKVKSQVKDYVSEIFLLNSLIKYNVHDRESKLEEMLNEYPKIRNVIPLILVIKNQVSLLSIQNYNFVSYDVDFSKSEPKIIVKFCKETGVLDLFDEIKDLHDYLIGVGVGRDTNARKNRSGDIFQLIIENYFKNNKISYVAQDSKFEFEDPESKRKKYPDFVIYKNNKPVAIIEVNFYNTTGSKPIEVVESYIKLHNDLKKQNLNFIWITDGPAWLKMKKSLEIGFNDIDYIFNYKLFSKYNSSLL